MNLPLPVNDTVGPPSRGAEARGFRPVFHGSARWFFLPTSRFSFPKIKARNRSLVFAEAGQDLAIAGVAARSSLPGTSRERRRPWNLGNQPDMVQTKQS